MWGLFFKYQSLWFSGENHDTVTCHSAYAVSTPAICIPWELKSARSVIHDHFKFPWVIWLSRPIYVFKMLVIQHGVPVMDVNDRSVWIVIQYINIQRWLAARHAPDLWLSPAPAAAPAHPSSPPCTPSPPEWNQQKNRPPIPPRGQLYFMSRIANGLCMVKKFGVHFSSPFRLQTRTNEVRLELFTTAGDEHGPCMSNRKYISIN